MLPPEVHQALPSEVHQALLSEVHQAHLPSDQPEAEQMCLLAEESVLEPQLLKFGGL